MGRLVIFALVLVGIASFSFAAVSMSNNPGAYKENIHPNFRIFTSAVCEDKNNLVYCRDELFLDCGGKTTKVSGVAECNGFKIDAPKVTGFATFSKDWKDPRA